MIWFLGLDRSFGVKLGLLHSESHLSRKDFMESDVLRQVQTEEQGDLGVDVPPLKRRRYISLKYKILALLILLPTFALATYAVIATNLFSKDKIAYVFESNAAQSRTLAAQARLQIQEMTNRIDRVMTGYLEDTKKLAPEMLAQLDGDSEWTRFFVYQPGNEPFQLLYQWSADQDTKDQTVDQPKDSLTLPQTELDQAYKKGVALFSLGPDSIWIAVRRGPIGNPTTKLAAIELSLDTFLAGFTEATAFSAFLLSHDGRVLVGPKNPVVDFSNLKEWEFSKKIISSSAPEGTSEVVAGDEKSLLGSYSRLEKDGPIVVSFVAKDSALKAIEILRLKSVLFFVLLGSVATILSVIFSSGMTSKLQELHQGTLKIAEGNFDVNIEVNSSDEVGGLAQGFNMMAKEVSRLLVETEEKARLQSELETAKTVQETLFPPRNGEFGDVRISGFYQPASECGGDWWHYCEIGNKIFLWIGDATGHGAPAALITSAAKSAATVIQTMPNISPATAMAILNRAIHETSKGKMLMTFFLASLDKTSGEFTYCNASHDPPYLLKNLGRPLKKKDIVTLNDVVGLRVGEKLNTTYEEATLQLSAGDMVMFYTDGMNDVMNPAKEAWGERNFIKSTLAAVAEKPEPKNVIEKIMSEAEAYRQGAPLIDDMTFFMCKMKDSA